MLTLRDTLKEFEIKGKLEDDMDANILYQDLENEYTNTKYYIPGNYYEVFLKHLAKAQENDDKSRKRVFNEKGQPIKKFIMDFDFKVPSSLYSIVSNSESRLMNDDFIHVMVKKIREILNDMYDFSSSDELYVMIKSAPTYMTIKDVEYTKDGLHLAIPTLTCDESTLLYIREQIMQQLFKEKGSLFTLLEELADSIVDKQILLKTAWKIYGNSKSGYDPYIVNYSYNMVTMEKSLPKATLCEYIKLFAMLYISRITDFKTGYKSNSIIYEKYKLKKEEYIVDDSGDKMYTKEELDKYWKILDNLAKTRYNDYEGWSAVGLTMSSFSHHNAKMFELFVRFSQKTTLGNFDLESCTKLWNSARPGAANERRLYNYLKFDNIVIYKQIVECDALVYILEHDPSWTDDCVATLAHIMGKDRFKVVSPKHNTFVYYEFTKHIWKERPNEISFHNFLKNEVSSLLIQAKTILDKRSNDALMSLHSIDNKMSDEIDIHKKRANAVYGLVKDIKTERHKASYVKAARDKFNDYDFLEDINKKSGIFMFKNGAAHNDGTFGDGNPDDKITLQCPHDYVVYDEKSYNIRYFLEIERFYEDIYPDPELREFVKKIDAKSLFETTGSESYMAIGEGKNGKSKKANLVSQAFGPDYYAEVDVGCMTGGRKKSGDTNTEKAKMRNKRTVYFSELGKNETITSALFKEMTGGGQVTGGRDLYQSARDSIFKCVARLWWQSNHYPKIDCEIDYAIIRRIRVVPYQVRFVSEDDPKIISNPKFFKCDDPDIDAKIEKWSEYYCSYLFYVYKTEVMGKPVPGIPQSMMDATNKYLSSINTLERFKNEMFKVGTDTDSIDFTLIYGKFTKWKSEAGFEEKYSKDEILVFLTSRFKDHVADGKFVGLCFKE